MNNFEYLKYIEVCTYFLIEAATFIGAGTVQNPQFHFSIVDRNSFTFQDAVEQVLALRDSYTLSLHSMLKEFQTKLQKHSTRVSKNIFSEILEVRGMESTR